MSKRMKENLKKNSPFGSAFGNDTADQSSDTDSEYSPLNESQNKKIMKIFLPALLSLLHFWLPLQELLFS